jgi:SpoVK/Ycf46/Vps4 family AAA+-type ATPase
MGLRRRSSGRRDGFVIVGAEGSERRGDGTSDPKRYLVYGVTGSGKTTRARKITEITGLPWHSMDDEASRSFCSTRGPVAVTSITKAWLRAPRQSR